MSEYDSEAKYDAGYPGWFLPKQRVMRGGQSILEFKLNKNETWKFETLLQLERLAGRFLQEVRQKPNQSPRYARFVERVAEFEEDIAYALRGSASLTPRQARREFDLADPDRLSQSFGNLHAVSRVDF